MANNTRQKIKNKLTSAQNDCVRLITNLGFIANQYAPPNLSDEDIFDIVNLCIQVAQENEVDDPLNIYIVLRRTDDIPDLGLYAPHLFNIVTIISLSNTLKDGIEQFKVWESKS